LPKRHRQPPKGGRLSLNASVWNLSSPEPSGPPS
jgi:hypothetical protein